MPTPTHEVTKVHWVDVIGNIAAPTMAEIGAGTDLTPFTPVAGVNIAATQNRASLAMLGDAFITEGMGTHSKSPTLTFVRDSVAAEDDAWTLLEYKKAGYLVISRFGTIAAASRVEVYPVEAGEPAMKPSAENELQQFDVEFAVTDTPNVKAVVAA